MAKWWESDPVQGDNWWANDPITSFPTPTPRPSDLGQQPSQTTDAGDRSNIFTGTGMPTLEAGADNVLGVAEQIPGFKALENLQVSDIPGGLEAKKSFEWLICLERIRLLVFRLRKRPCL